MSGARDLGWVAMARGRWAPHLPGPAPRTMCSSCPRASRGSPHPGAAWAAQPPWGMGRGREGGGLTPATRAPEIRVPTQALRAGPQSPHL